MEDEMKVLIGCEFSGIVRDAFLEKGHDAMSCDLLPSEKAGPHYQGDVMDIINDGWDLAIFHPPCTYLTVTANRVSACNPDRWQKRLDAVKFVWELMNADIPRICIENPKGVLSTYIRKPDQYIQPYEYGHPDSKMTGLWLKDLPLLKPTNVVNPEWVISTSGKRHSKTHWSNPNNSTMRSRTYIGIGKAMATQWSDL
jgi:hypothetical protein